MALLEKDNITQIEAFIIHEYYGCIMYWKEHINQKIILEKLLNSLQKLVNVGNNEYVSYLALDYCLIKFFGGCNLKELEQDYYKCSQLIQSSSL
ncbi:MAG UNVERIFIED_CONTAM: hypothetical protein LVR29_21450 [Microcystis novacekii LVE1205-3]|jgi:hypothetical protein